MMAYSAGFTVSVLLDGRPLREQNNNNERTVRLPFGKEYSIRLQNKNDVRALARIAVDGTDIHSGKFVLAPGEHVDIERFCLDGDLSSGSKLKFVEASNAEVQDPDSKDNGLIEVTFEKEACPAYIMTCNSSDLGGVLRGSSFAWEAASAPCSIAGATIEGSQSYQAFQNVNVHFPVLAPEIISVRMRGPSKQVDKVWSVKFNSGEMVISSGEHKLGFIQESVITPTHLVIKIPIERVQIG